MISAHWEEKSVTVMSNEKTKLLYDYGGIILTYSYTSDPSTDSGFAVDQASHLRLTKSPIPRREHQRWRSGYGVCSRR